MMSVAELKTKSKTELNELLLKLHEEQFQLKMQKSMTENPKTHLFSVNRKNIARIRTVLNSL